VHARARRLRNNVVELTPSARIANYHLGVNLPSLGDYDRAIANFKLVVENCPEDEAALYHLGMAYYGANRISEAKETFRQAPNDRRAAQMLEMLVVVPDV
jgi:tetratricopeptide (TPR) repeat protein